MLGDLAEFLPKDAIPADTRWSYGWWQLHGSTEASVLARALIRLGSQPSGSYLITSSADLIYSPIANPLFTGTLTAPTINATSALQVGGVDSSSLFQHRAFISAVIPVGQAGLVSGVVWNGSATNFEVSQLCGLGAYRFQWTPAIPSSHLFFGNLRNSAGFVSCNGAGTAGLNCQTYVANGTQSDIASGYHVMMLRNP